MENEKDLASPNYGSTVSGVVGSVAMASAAQAAGASLDLSSVDSAINQLKGGVTGNQSFASSTFRVAPFSAEDIVGISEYISITDNSLVFTRP